MEAVFVKSEALKISMLFCKYYLIFVRSNIFKPITLNEGHQCKRNQQKLLLCSMTLENDASYWNLLAALT